MDFVHILSQALIRNELLPDDFDVNAHMELVAMQPGDVPVTYSDTSPLENDYGFRPETSLEDGLDSFARWYKEFYK